MIWLKAFFPKISKKKVEMLICLGNLVDNKEHQTTKFWFAAF